MKELAKAKGSRKLIKACHKCNQVTESDREIERCPKCSKAFLPLNYFDKIHFDPNARFNDLFTHCDEINEEDLIKGIHVLWG